MVGKDKRFIVDSSFVLSFLLPDESQEVSTNAFLDFKQGEIEFLSTSLLPFEISNSLKSATLTKRFNQQTALELLDVFIDYQIPLLETDWRTTLEASIANSISFYDACYLQLARTNNLPLLTLDKHLQKLTSKGSSQN